MQNHLRRLCAFLCLGLVLGAPRLMALASGPFALDLPSDPLPDHVSCNEPLASGQSKVVATLDGPGCIRHLWFVVGHPDGSPKMTSRKVILRIYFDDAKNPNVEAPIGDFFGIMHGQDYYDINTSLVSVIGANGYNCYFEMPFARNARIELLNGGDATSFYCQVDWHRYPGQEMKEARRFCAQWRREMPAPRYGDDYLLLDADGPGDLIGYFYGVRLLDDTDRWSHGGAENMFIDGMADHPAYIRGIGGEDTFGTSYGGVIHPPDSHLYSGMPYYYTADVGQARGAQRVVGYRFYLMDRMPFKQSLRIQFGSMANDICSTVFWYQKGEPRRFFAMPQGEKLLPGVEFHPAAVTAAASATWGIGELQDNANGAAIKQALNPGSAPASQHWIQKDAYNGFINFARVYRPKTRGPGTFYSGKAATATAVLDAPSDLMASVRLAWDDQMVVRFNADRPIDLGSNAHFRDRTISVPLHRGRNTVAVTLTNESGSNHGGWVFALRALAPDGSVLVPHFDDRAP